MAEWYPGLNTPLVRIVSYDSSPCRSPSRVKPKGGPGYKAVKSAHCQNTGKSTVVYGVGISRSTSSDIVAIGSRYTVFVCYYLMNGQMKPIGS